MQPSRFGDSRPALLEQLQQAANGNPGGWTLRGRKQCFWRRAVPSIRIQGGEEQKGSPVPKRKPVSPSGSLQDSASFCGGGAARPRRLPKCISLNNGHIAS